jgi:hypothetical protein
VFWRNETATIASIKNTKQLGNRVSVPLIGTGTTIIDTFSYCTTLEIWVSILLKLWKARNSKYLGADSQSSIWGWYVRSVARDSGRSRLTCHHHTAPSWRRKVCFSLHSKLWITGYRTYCQHPFSFYLCRSGTVPVQAWYCTVCCSSEIVSRHLYCINFFFLLCSPTPLRGIHEPSTSESLIEDAPTAAKRGRLVTR